MKYVSATRKKIFFISILLLSVISLGFSKTPSRIVCLAPNGAEILYALGCGNKIVARTDYCDYPAQVLGKPSLGRFDGKSFSIESILAYDPDFVYMVGGIHDTMSKSLVQFGINFYESNATSIEAVFDEILDIAKIMGCKENGENLVKKMKTELELLQKKGEVFAKKSGSPKIYCEIFSSPYMSIGKNSFLNDIITDAGAKNIFDDINTSYPQVSEESIITKNPDFIIVPYYSTLQIDAMYKRNGWESISAVKNHRIYPIDENIFSRPGPRVIEAIKILQNIIQNEGNE